jgi:hypothetical protein
MKEFTLQDTLRVSDSKIKGFVVMEREDGTTVFAKPNMIVENGRNFIKDLVYKQVSTDTETRKFSHISFGSGITPTIPTMEDLEIPITDLSKGTVDNSTPVDISDTNLVWSEITTTYSYGLVLPTSAVTGELFVMDNEDTTYTLYTATAVDTWDAGVALDSTIILPDITTEDHGDYIFSTRNNKLYYASYVLEVLPSNNAIGLKITIDVIGTTGVDKSSSELGLFLSDDTLFSRVVFDPVPITDTLKYKLTYYIYF